MHRQCAPGIISFSSYGNKEVTILVIQHHYSPYAEHVLCLQLSRSHDIIVQKVQTISSCCHSIPDCTVLNCNQGQHQKRRHLFYILLQRVS